MVNFAERRWAAAAATRLVNQMFRYQVGERSSNTVYDARHAHVISYASFLSPSQYDTRRIKRGGRRANARKSEHKRGLENARCSDSYSGHMEPNGGGRLNERNDSSDSLRRLCMLVASLPGAAKLDSHGAPTVHISFAITRSGRGTASVVCSGQSRSGAQGADCWPHFHVQRQATAHESIAYVIAAGTTALQYRTRPL